MITTIEEMNREYETIEKQLDKVSKTIFTIDENTNILEVDLAQLSTDIENLGISLAELNEKVGLDWN